MSASKSKANNSVTLFSNGMGHFQRIFTVCGRQAKKISIPFKRAHISDVLESLAVFGNVRLESPPSFTPTNSNSTALTIDSTDASKSLYTALSGALVKVKIDEDYGFDLDDDEYTLLGTESEDIGDDGNCTYLVIMRSGRVIRLPMIEVDSVEFTEEAVQSEIKKALTNNFQKIKPDSTFLDLTLSRVDLNGVDTEGNDTDNVVADEMAVIQYKIPVAAWKMRYNIRHNGDKFLLEGAAIIDNNTDEDWNDVLISVVTGNPISFYSPKMAAITVPVRQTLDVIDSNALGAVSVEESVESFGGGSVGASRGMARRVASVSPAAYSATMGFNSVGFDNTIADSADYNDELKCASSPGVDSKEVGDFCVFTSKEVISIASKRSAIVTMFSVPLNTASTILIYKEKDHARRPYRAVKFKNEAGFDLGKGKVVIYIDNVFSGEAVLETAKPGENRLLPHCLENGVKVATENKGREQIVCSINFAKGVVVTKTMHTSVTEYNLVNKKDEAFKILIEHPEQMASNSNYEFAGIEVKDVEKLTSGVRVYIELAPKQAAKLIVSETYTAERKVEVGNDYHWLHNNVVQSHRQLLDDESLRNCANLQRAIDEQNRRICGLQKKVQEAEREADQLRKNIESSNKAAKDSASEANSIQARWVIELDELTKEVKDIRKKHIPELETERDRVQAELSEAMSLITTSWSSF